MNFLCLLILLRDDTTVAVAICGKMVWCGNRRQKYQIFSKTNSKYNILL